MDSSSPPPPNTGLASVYLIPCGILLAVEIGLCTARILTRRCHLYRDDYLIAMAMIISFSEYVLAGIAVVNGWGRHTSYVSPENQKIALKLLFAIQIHWLFATALARISVSWSLLRLRKALGGIEKIWTWSLGAIILLQVLSYVGWMVFWFFSCHPLRGMWEPVPDLVCWPAEASRKYSQVALSIVVVLDFFLATIPVQFIRSLTRPIWERILISCLMATGLLATSIAIYKITTANPISSDPLWTGVKPFLWCKLEEQVGIIGACLPCLKGPAERALRRMGIIANQVDLLQSFVVSLREAPLSRFPISQTPSTDPKDISRNESGAALVSLNQTNWYGGAVTGIKNTAASSDTKAVGSNDWDSQ